MPENDRDNTRRYLEIHAELGRTREDVDILKEDSIKYGLRLDNGQRAFMEMEAKIPVPMAPAKLLSWAFAIFIACTGGLWTLSTYLADRPTHAQAEKAIHSHDKNGHSSLRNDVRAIQNEQAAQRVRIETVQTGIDTQNVKLDTLILQTKPRNRRRNR